MDTISTIEPLETHEQFMAAKFSADDSYQDHSSPDIQLEMVEADFEVKALSPAEQAFAKINANALQQFGLVVRFLGLPGKSSAWYFTSKKLRINNDETPIAIDKTTGNWEYLGNDPELPYGRDLISLAEHRWKLPRYAAAARLKKFLAAVDCRQGLEEFEEIALNSASGGTQVVPVPSNGPPIPDTFGGLDDCPQDFPLLSPSGQLLGYTRQIIDFGSYNPQTGLGQILRFPLICWRLPDGSLGWQNYFPSAPHHLYGVEKLGLNRSAPVIVADDEWSAHWAEDMLPRNLSEAIGVGFISAPDSERETDLSPLLGRTVYILSCIKGRAEAIRERLWRQNPRTRVAIVGIELLTASEARLNDGEELISLESDVPDTTNWTLPQFRIASLENHWPLKLAFPKPAMQLDKFSVGDFVVNDAGVHVQKFKDEVPYLKHISSRIDVTARARSSESTEWGVCLEFNDHADVTHVWCVPQSALGGDNAFCRQLLSMGIYVSPNAADRQSLAEYLLINDPRRMARAVFKPGWDKNLFVFPDGSHIGHSDERVSYQTSDPHNQIFSQSGSLEDWRRNVAQPCQGNSRLMLALATALTGPVLPLLGEESGGFHFPGESSTGKTTALHPACSVWGKPENVITRWRATANGIEAKAVQHNHTLYAMDEMSQVSPQEAGQIVYMLANGQGKVRATQDASTKPVSSWQLMMLSTGEVGLEQHMATAGIKVMAGQQARLIDVAADAGAGLGVFENVHGHANGAEFSVFIKNQSAQYYGVAGRTWVSALADLSQRSGILDSIRADIDEFCCRSVPDEADGQVRRVARRFGLVAGVAEACVKLGILPWTAGEATEAIRRCFSQWVENRGGVGNLEADQALNQLRQILVERGESGFTDMVIEGIEASSSNRVTVQRLGFRRLAEDGHTDYFILPDAFKAVVCAGMNPREVTKRLVAAHVLVCGSDGKAQYTQRLPGMGTQKVYFVRSTVLGEREST